MKEAIVITLSLFIVLSSGVSCKKKCTIAEDTESGMIISDLDGEKVIIYPSSGFLTSSMGGNYHIDSLHLYSHKFEVSFDGGYTKQSVNLDAYNILANPCIVKCDASIDRSVTYDALNHYYTYTVTVTECPNGCDFETTLENYVLIPSIDPNATVIYNVVYNE